MYPHCTVRIRLLYAFNKYFDFDFEVMPMGIFVRLPAAKSSRVWTPEFAFYEFTA